MAKLIFLGMFFAAAFMFFAAGFLAAIFMPDHDGVDSWPFSFFVGVGAIISFGSIWAYGMAKLIHSIG